MYVVYVVEFISKKQRQMSTRAEKVSISLSFSLSSKTIVVVVFAFVGESHMMIKARRRRRKQSFCQSFVFGFLCQNRREKDPKKKLKSYHF